MPQVSSTMFTQYHLSLGGLQIGAWVATLLYGVMCVQAYTYYTSDSDACGSRHVRTLTACIWFLDTLHTVISCVYIYDLTVTHYGEPNYLTSVPWSLPVGALLGAIVATSAKAFFTWRLWKLSRSTYLACCGWALAPGSPRRHGRDGRDGHAFSAAGLCYYLNAPKNAIYPSQDHRVDAGDVLAYEVGIYFILFLLGLSDTDLTGCSA
ncbi:hypothetical protein PUNSTDRAFT_137986 [Punctularia strigosozonata HHB-11173 SS5]|uniref:Uncharacterized protein n=1 Tax=Punctularia strigosozonata (strain HHB-11173) TaxID=741275 RepID=R7S4Y7_PUNST|nr:uncharacterized protein PUNSTDRAFT_137986 [Punctularia strigosozonata HHB-11173 SS5]EIN05303.1 hypothetical protein PUNSTDRAFT_137986 [Punctularia strigosozonata HHB-11173 SS5]